MVPSLALLASLRTHDMSTGSLHLLYFYGNSLFFVDYGLLSADPNQEIDFDQGNFFGQKLFRTSGKKFGRIAALPKLC